jgi:hypothetical protein
MFKDNLFKKVKDKTNVDKSTIITLAEKLQNANMKDEETGILKVAKAKANIVLAEDKSCQERYVLQYKWNKRDVSKEGFYKGWFEIAFNGNITSEGIEYPTGNLIVPIEEDLRIIVK